MRFELEITPTDSGLNAAGWGTPQDLFRLHNERRYGRLSLSDYNFEAI